MKSCTIEEAWQSDFELAQQDDTIIAISGDCIGNFGLLQMQEAMPKRVINTGIAEQNAMNVAAGYAATGFKPVICGFVPFMTLRAAEQLRTFICYPNLKVMVAGGMGGLSAATEGVTHMGLEDIGVLRTIPNMVIAVPADAASTRAITRSLMMDTDCASYIRLNKLPVYGVFDENYKFEIGKANPMIDNGNDATIFVNGPLVYRAVLASEALRAEGIDIRVVEMPCVKPLDKEAVFKAAEETGAIVTVEDHQITGGLGSAVAEYLSEVKPTLVKRLGIPDVFPESGSHFDLLDKYGMSEADIISAVKEIVLRKGCGTIDFDEVIRSVR